MFNDPPEEVGRKWCQWSGGGWVGGEGEGGEEVYLPLFKIHPVPPPAPHLTLPPLSAPPRPASPSWPALSSQNPSPINPSLSVLAPLRRLVKDWHHRNSPNIDFFFFGQCLLSAPPTPTPTITHLPQHLCHGSGASRALPPS